MSDSGFHRITKGLFIGDLKAAKNLNLLQSHSISHLLICGAELDPLYPDYFIIKKLGILDNWKFEIGDCFMEGIEFLNQTICNSGNILVYCNKGKSRSPTIVIGYLMKYHDLKFTYALERVKKLHPQTSPIKSFIRFLRDFEGKLSTDKSNSCYCNIW